MAKETIYYNNGTFLCAFDNKGAGQGYCPNRFRRNFDWRTNFGTHHRGTSAERTTGIS